MDKEANWLLKEKYQGQTTEEYYADLKRLKNGEPLAYLIGHIPFLDCTIYLDSKPLIPRTETEYWVGKVITELKTKPDTVTILDLCAGSGCIGVAIAKHLPNSQVTLAEIDKNHLPTIGKNLQANNISCDRYQVFQSDLFNKIAGKFDVILTNPPYIDGKLNRTAPSVKKFEPSQALYGGKAGIELITQIIKTAPTHLNAHGLLFIEHEPEQSQAITKLAKANNFDITVLTDQYKIKRYSRLQLKKA